MRRSVSASSASGVPGTSLRRLRDPARHDLARHLRVELDAPGGLAEPERLRADPAPGQLHAAGRHVEGVEVPLEGGEASREIAEHRVVRGVRGELDLDPADLRLAPPVPRVAPAALATSWAPRQTPSSGVRRVEQRARSARARLRARGGRASWSACIAPPKSITAPYSVDRPRRRGLGGDAPGRRAGGRAPSTTSPNDPGGDVRAVDDREDVHTPRSSCASAAGSRPPVAGMPGLVEQAAQDPARSAARSRRGCCSTARRPPRPRPRAGRAARPTRRAPPPCTGGRSARPSSSRCGCSRCASCGRGSGRRRPGAWRRRSSARRSSRGSAGSRPRRTRARAARGSGACPRSSSSVTQRAVAELDQRHERLEQPAHPRQLVERLGRLLDARVVLEQDAAHLPGRLERRRAPRGSPGTPARARTRGGPSSRRSP